MLFPTIDFAIFFAVAYTVNWLLNPYAGWWKLVHDRAELRVLRLGGLELLPAPAGHHRGAFGGAAVGHRPRRRAEPTDRHGGHRSARCSGSSAGSSTTASSRSTSTTSPTPSGSAGPSPSCRSALPIAISFFTFMAISYVVDVYRRRARAGQAARLRASTSRSSPTCWPDRSCGGPSCCPRSAGAATPNSVDYSRAFWLILAGLFKKVVISSYVSSAIVDARLHVPQPALRPRGDLRGLGLRGADLLRLQRVHRHRHRARPAARLSASRRTSTRPYTARDLQDFWRRWHMTLSRWLRDYLYIPLGGSRGGQAQTVRNIMITMVLGGLWHGAAWTFVVWGALHGRRAERRAPAPHAAGCAAGCRRWPTARCGSGCSASSTFQFVCLGWVFFNASGMSQAFAVLGRRPQRAGGRPPRW